MINKEEKSMFEGEKMSFVIIGTTLLLSFIIMYFCKAVTSNSDNGVDISNLKVAQNKAEEYYFERQYEKAIAEYIKQGEGQEWPINKVKIAASKYYQLTQFKRVMFTCTEIKYDAESSERVNGRINGMKFKIKTDSTGEIIFN